MKKNILLLVFISLLQPMFIWGMKKKTNSLEEEIVDLDLSKLPNDADFLCKAIFVFCPQKMLLVFRLVSKYFDNCIAFSTRNGSPIKANIYLPSDQSKLDKYKVPPAPQFKVEVFLCLESKITNELLQKTISVCKNNLINLNIGWSTKKEKLTNFTPITECPQLVELNLTESKITNQQLSEILLALTKLQTLDLGSCKNITQFAGLPFPQNLKCLYFSLYPVPEDIKHLTKSSPLLEKLSFYGEIFPSEAHLPASSIRKNFNAALKEMANFKYLKCLTISRPITIKRLNHLLKHIPSLTAITISLEKNEKAFSEIQTHKNLKTFIIKTSLTQDELIIFLKALSSLCALETEIKSDTFKAVQPPCHKNLKKLQITLDTVHPDILRFIFNTFSNLSRLIIEGKKFETFNNIPICKTLDSLRLARPKVTWAESITTKNLYTLLKSLPKLSRLSINRHITDNDVDQNEKIVFPSVVIIEIRKIAKNDVESFLNKFPNILPEIREDIIEKCSSK